MRHSGKWFLGSLYYEREKEIERKDREGTAPFFEELKYDSEVQGKILEMLAPVNFCKLCKINGWSNEYLRRRFKLDKI